MVARLFPGVYEGWIVVGASTTMLFILSASVFWGLGPIFNPILDEFGWSHGATAFAFAVRSEVNGAAAPFVGALIDRFGSRLLLVVGLVLASCCLFLLSFMENIVHFYVLMLVMALGTSTCGGQATMVSTVSWFERKRRARWRWRRRAARSAGSSSSSSRSSWRRWVGARRCGSWRCSCSSAACSRARTCARGRTATASRSTASPAPGPRGIVRATTATSAGACRCARR